MQDKASSVNIGVADNNVTRGGQILHEQEYNTGHGVSAIPDEIHREMRCESREPEVQQKPVVYLLLEDPLGWNSGLFGLPVQTASQPSQPAYRGRVEVDPGYAPPQP